VKIYVGRYRVVKGLTQKELSILSGVAASHIHNIENGVKVPTISTLCKISKALGVPCSELFTCND